MTMVLSMTHLLVLRPVNETVVAIACDPLRAIGVDRKRSER